MEFFLSAVKCVCIASIALSLYLLVRNYFVFTYRMKVINTNFDRYDLLPSYHTMMWKFWVWPMDKFMPEDKQKLAVVRDQLQ